MKWKFLIGESGGSKTDWCLVDAVGKRRYFTTESYHPEFIDDGFMDRNRRFWSEQALDEIRLEFFGAGCYREDGAERMAGVLADRGFQQLAIHSDMLGAALAANNGDGWCAICGTGSVVFKVKDRQIVKLIGGKGHVDGDEGSGFYFGKLFMEEARISPDFRSKYRAVLGENMTWDDLLIDPASYEAKKRYARLPWLFRNQQNDALIRELHRKNIRRFTALHLDGVKELGLCGSYAFYHSHLFREIMEEEGVRITHIIERPIERLTDHLINDTAY